MSTLNAAVDPSGNEDDANFDEKGDKENINVPAWGWGVIGGGVALLSTLGVVTWHFASRRYRINRARRELLAEAWKETEVIPHNGTPRDFASDTLRQDSGPTSKGSEKSELIV